MSAAKAERTDILTLKILEKKLDTNDHEFIINCYAQQII